MAGELPQAGFLYEDRDGYLSTDPPPKPPMLGLALIVALCSLFWGVVGFVIGWLVGS
jgi:hypothetical protein